VSQTALSCAVISVHKFAQNTQMFTLGHTRFREQNQALPAERVVTLDIDVGVFLFAVVVEVNADDTTNCNTSSEEFGLERSSDGDLDRVVVVVFARGPSCSSSEDITGDCWSTGASLGTLVPSVVTVVLSIAQQKRVDAFHRVLAASQLSVGVAVIVDSFNVINPVVQIVQESFRIDFLGLYNSVVHFTEFPLNSTESDRTCRESWLDEASDANGPIFITSRQRYGR